MYAANRKRAQLLLLAFWLITSVCLHVLIPYSWAQSSQPMLYLNNEIRFEHLSIKQGLSNNTVSAFLQDREGFLWVGTNDGLNKFDGYTFTTYHPGTSETGSAFSFTYVTDLYEDKKGVLWVSTINKGLSKLDKQTSKFISYQSDSTEDSNQNTCFAIHEDKNGIFWIPSFGGLSRFDPETEKFILYPHPVPGGFLTLISEDNWGQLWVGSQQGLYQFNPETKIFTLFILDAAHPESSFIHSMYKDSSGMLWISVFNIGLYQFDPALKQVVAHYPFHKKGLAGHRINPNAMLEDEGKLWLGTNQGLQQLDPTTGQFITYQPNPSFPGSLSSVDVWTVYKDRSGILWIGTDRGIDKLIPQTGKFQTYQFTPNLNYAHLPENNIEPAYQDRSGVIWLSNSPGPGGLYRFDRKQGKLTRYGANPADSHRLMSNHVTGDAILEDHSGVLWIGAGETLHALEPKTGKFTRYPVGNFFWQIREDIYGKIWIDGKGIASLDPKTGRFTRYQYDAKDSTSIGDNGVGALLASRSGDIWVGGLGISKLNQTTGKFTRYKPNAANQKGYLNDMIITCFYEGADGSMWIGTGSGGINRFDPKTQLFTAFTIQDGLPSNQIRGITGDASGNLWFTTNKGLCRFNPKTKACRTFDESDGVMEDEFHFGSVQYRHGEILVHGHNGFTIFNPDNLRNNTQVPPVYITGFKIFDKHRPFSNTFNELTYRENFISFDFVTLNYLMPEKNQHAYKLVGVDKEWVYSGTRRYASYPGLSPGRYTFRVKGANNDGIWNEQGASLYFIIHPPFYLTWWFKTLGALITFGLLYSGFRYRVGQIRKEEAQKTEFHRIEEEQKTQFNKKLYQMEMQALRAQMNPHFIFNSLNSINCFILENETQAASDYLAKFSRLIRLILQNSNSSTIPLKNELEALGLYLQMEALRFEDKFSYSIKVYPQVDQEYLQIPPLIIQPYVENAIWHGLMHKVGTGHIHIHLQQDNQVLVCTIEDNGIGRRKASELKSKSATRRKSMGMQITSHRLELINCLYGKESTVEIIDLVDSVGAACGTRVVLRIPV